MTAAFDAVLPITHFCLHEVPTRSAPLVIRTFSGFHNVKAFTGAADQDRHELQWQNPIASGEPLTSISTAPQKQRP
jgi:hypothetical protein